MTRIHLTLRLAAALIIAAAGAPALAGDPAAADVLTGKDLTKQKVSSTAIPWVLADEAKVHPLIEPLRKLESAHRAAAKKVTDEAYGAKRDKQDLDAAQKQYDLLNGYKNNPQTIPRELAARFRSTQQMQQALTDDFNRQAETLNRLRPKLAAMNNGGATDAVKSAIVAWMKTRSDLLLAYLAAEPDFTALNEQYKALEADDEVAAALKSLGKKNRLGSQTFDNDRHLMAGIETAVVNGELPTYRDGPFDFVPAILNEKLPIVLKIESVDPKSVSWFPTEVLAKAGVEVDANSPSTTLNFIDNGKKRVFQCRQIKVPKLRLGKFVFEDLNCLAMPPEAKDLGSQLIMKELDAYDQTADRDHWLIKLTPKAAAAEK